MKELSPNERNELKKQVKTIKPTLPANWRKRLLEKMPELDNQKGLILINNVVQFRTVDQLITDNLKIISKEFLDQINSVHQTNIQL